MARRNEHSKDELKFLALEASVNIIKSQGIDQLSTRKIAKEIGYAASSLYNIFENTDDIILHINSQTMLEIMQIFTEKVNTSSNLVKDKNLLELIISDYLDYIENNYQIWCCLFEYKKDFGEDLPAWYVETVQFILESMSKCIDNEDSSKAEFIWTSVNGVCFVASTSASMDKSFAETKAKCLKILDLI